MIESTQAWLRLAMTPNLSSLDALRLVQGLGSPQLIFESSISSLTPFISKDLARTIVLGHQHPSVESIRQWAEQEECHILTLDHPSFPLTLTRHPFNIPLVLFARGNLQLLNQSTLGIIHNSVESDYGDTLSSHTLNMLGARPHITPLLSFDEGACAHFLEKHPRSIAIAHTGLNRVYPSTLRPLAHAIVKHGLLISPWMPEQSFDEEHLAHTYQLLSNMSDALLILESNRFSLTLKSAQNAAEQAKPVFVFPGPIDHASSSVCHRLIQDGADLVLNAQDISDAWDPFKIQKT